MNNKKKTFSIGIPAYNEEENIENLLNSIIRQKKKNFILESIYVVNDGSNDKTSDIVMKIEQKCPALHLISDGKRKGKIKRLSEILNLNTSDIIFPFLFPSLIRCK